MKLLLTGAAGFIGQYTLREAEKRGIEVIPFDKVNGLDIQNKEQIHKIMKNCNAVIHLAGSLGTAELFTDGQMAVDTNIKGSLNVIEICKDYNIHYTTITMPFTEWISVYQITKQCAMDLARSYHQYFNMPVSFVRAYNCYGPSQKVHGVQKLVPTFSTKAWRNEPIPIWGTGQQSVDLIHVDGVARMLVDALSFGDGAIFDAGTGDGLTVNQIADIILDITKSTAGVIHLPMRKGELQEGLPPIAQGEGWDKLSWKPEFDLDKFRETVQYYKEDRP